MQLVGELELYSLELSVDATRSSKQYDKLASYYYYPRGSPRGTPTPTGRPFKLSLYLLSDIHEMFTKCYHRIEFEAYFELLLKCFKLEIYRKYLINKAWPRAGEFIAFFRLHKAKN